MGVTRQQMAPLKRAVSAKKAACLGMAAMVAPVRTRSVRAASSSEKAAREEGVMAGILSLPVMFVDEDSVVVISLLLVSLSSVFIGPLLLVF